MAVGFVLVRIGLIGEAGVRWLVLFVFNAAIPVMLFYRIATIDFPAQIAWGFLFGYYASAFAAYGLGMLSARFFFHRSIEEQAIHGLGAGFSNTVLLGIPLMLSAFGDQATVPVFLVISFHSATLLPISIILIESVRQPGGQASQFRIARLILEVLAGDEAQQILRPAHLVRLCRQSQRLWVSEHRLRGYGCGTRRSEEDRDPRTAPPWTT